MIDGWSAVSGTAAALGTLFAVISTIASLRGSRSRKHVERARDAAALLRELDSLASPRSPDARLRVNHDDQQLRNELARVLRENAAAFALRNPTTTGADILRLLVPLYALIFAVLTIASWWTLSSSSTDQDQAGQGIVTVVLLAGTLFFVAAAVVLWARMFTRNTSRALAGTPGSEKYFYAFDDIASLYRSWHAKRQARKLD